MESKSLAANEELLNMQLIQYENPQIQWMYIVGFISVGSSLVCNRQRQNGNHSFTGCKTFKKRKKIKITKQGQSLYQIVVSFLLFTLHSFRSSISDSRLARAHSSL